MLPISKWYSSRTNHMALNSEAMSSWCLIRSAVQFLLALITHSLPKTLVASFHRRYHTTPPVIATRKIARVIAIGSCLGTRCEAFSE
jgi:hypothetical protein